MSRHLPSSLVLLLTPVLAACGQALDVATTPPVPSPTATTASLAQVEWQLVEVVEDGDARPVQRLDSVLRFDGRGGWSAHACNYLEGTSQHGDGWVHVEWGASTAMACDADVTRVEREVQTVLDGRVPVELADGVLRLGRPGGTQLVYRERASSYPTTQGETVLAGERGQAQYRVALHRGGPSLSLSMEARPTPGTAWDTTSFGAPEPGVEPGIWTSGALEVDGQQLLAGFAPAGTVRLTHRAGPGEPAADELAVHELAGSTWVVWSGFVDAHSADSRFTASAEDGTVLATW